MSWACRPYKEVEWQGSTRAFGLFALPQVDSKTDALIQDTIRHHFATATVIVIAHRLTTLAHMDRIVQLDAGAVVRDGPPSAFIGVQ